MRPRTRSLHRDHALAAALMASLLPCTGVAEVRFNPAQAALDRDRNGAISAAEAPPMLARWISAADQDGSGDLSPAEFHGLLGSLLPPRLPEGQTPAPAPPLNTASGSPAWSDVDAYISAMTRDLPLEGASLVVIRDGQVVHQRAYGLYDLDSQIPIASATKWLNAALIMTVVDEGKLDLDAPISTYLDWARGPMGSATLRQLLSHTGGFSPSHLADQPRSLSLEASARDAFARPPVGAPGAQFRYGGAGMQVAAFAAEKVTGIPYAQLFEARITGPLGMTNTHIGFAQKREDRASVTNPIAAAGGYSTAADYARFLEMLAGGGQFRGRAILSEKAIREMFRDYSERRATLGAGTSVGDQRGYGLGAWCNEITADGVCSVVQSGGAFGTSPVVKVNERTVILLMVKDRMPQIRAHWAVVTEAIASILATSAGPRR